jgi:hypothetical protein
MVTESMDLDAIQTKLTETSNIAWLTLVALNAGFTGMTAAAYLASLPRSPTGLSSGSLWVNAASNQLNFVP